jgi:hypothetical protein
MHEFFRILQSAWLDDLGELMRINPLQTLTVFFAPDRNGVISSVIDGGFYKLSAYEKREIVLEMSKKRRLNDGKGGG